MTVFEYQNIMQERMSREVYCNACIHDWSDCKAHHAAGCVDDAYCAAYTPLEFAVGKTRVSETVKPALHPHRPKHLLRAR